MQTEITHDAIAKAERIMRRIDARWPGNAMLVTFPTGRQVYLGG